MSFKGHSSNSYEKARRSAKESSSSHASSSSASASSDGAFKLVLVGDSGVGKSCLLEKLLDGASDNRFISTIGVSVKMHQMEVQGQSCKLQIWDTGGQQRYRPVLSTCYRSAHGVIVVFDVTNAQSFQNLKQWMDEIAEFGNKSNPPPKLLVGNKCDLESRREVERSRGEDFASKNNMIYVETSAIDTINVQEAFLSLVKSADSSVIAAAAAAAATTDPEHLRKMMQKKSASTSS